MQPITMHPIGIIHSPYTDGMDMPIQGIFNSAIEACVELKDKYAGGLKDLDGFSHAIILYYFHKSQREDIPGWIQPRDNPVLFPQIAERRYRGPAIS